MFKPSLCIKIQTKEDIFGNFFCKRNQQNLKEVLNSRIQFKKGDEKVALESHSYNKKSN